MRESLIQQLKHQYSPANHHLAESDPGLANHSSLRPILVIYYQ